MKHVWKCLYIWHSKATKPFQKLSVKTIILHFQGLAMVEREMKQHLSTAFWGTILCISHSVSPDKKWGSLVDDLIPIHPVKQRIDTFGSVRDFHF